jgi:hypothetical protein
MATTKKIITSHFGKLIFNKKVYTRARFGRDKQGRIYSGKYIYSDFIDENGRTQLKIEENPWVGGKHGGSITNRGTNKFQVQLTGKAFKKLKKGKTKTFKTEARAKAYRKRMSLECKATKNRYRFMCDHYEGEVRCKGETKMICKFNLNKLSLFTENWWYVVKKGQNNFYVVTNGFRKTDPEKSARFHQHVMTNLKIIDHINRNELDNRIENLRDGSKGVNSNMSKSKDNTSGISGVQRNVKRENGIYWRAIWTEKDGKQNYGKCYNINDYGGEDGAMVRAILDRRAAEKRLGIINGIEERFPYR